MRQHPEAVMMFAAGLGTRMLDLTKDQPKPLIKVAGKALVDHALDLTRGAGLNKVVANLHYKPQKLQYHLEVQGVQTLIESPEILETGGGLRNALPMLGEGPVFTLNTDAIWAGPNPLRLLAKAWNPDSMDALMICIPVAQTIGYAGNGDFSMDAEGRLSRGPGMVYGGIQIIKTDRLSEIKESKFSLNLLWNLLQHEGRLFGLNYPGKWCDVGHPQGITLAENMLENAGV
ncbi:MAG: MurNAc alpha-1-phosphate uridylyltransferase [Sulfitobacter sp.]|jgi:N-acetyl-alpha-D-muramate 1-phosphate uridylyltransferase